MAESEIKKCPMCGRETLWDEMIWLNGECTCPTCYGYKRRALDREPHLRGTDNEDVET